MTNREFIAVPIRISLRFMLMMRCRAIVCSQYEQDCEQAHACSIAPYGTACRNAQIRIYRDERWNVIQEDKQPEYRKSTDERFDKVLWG